MPRSNICCEWRRACAAASPTQQSQVQASLDERKQRLFQIMQSLPSESQEVIQSTRRQCYCEEEDGTYDRK